MSADGTQIKCTKCNKLLPRDAFDTKSNGDFNRQCKECGGSQICEHGKRKSRCKECGGGSICEHGKIKSHCKECGGSSICEHGKIKSTCKDCGGGSICEHGKIKSHCKECGGSSLCKSVWCDIRASNKYDGYCLRCYMHLFPDKPVSRNYKTKEYAVVEFIQNNFPDINIVTDKRIQDGCSSKRPDVLIDLGYCVIIVEIDENQHTGYDCSCDNKRLMEISRDVQHRPIVFLRFNPDAYMINDKKISSCWGVHKLSNILIVKRKQDWEARLHTLKEHIDYWLDGTNVPDKTITVIELFYDR